MFVKILFAQRGKSDGNLREAIFASAYLILQISEPGSRVRFLKDFSYGSRLPPVVSLNLVLLASKFLAPGGDLLSRVRGHLSGQFWVTSICAMRWRRYFATTFRELKVA